MGESGQKSKFQNTSPGVAGAVILDHEGKAKGIPVAPRAEIWLSLKEQGLTAMAPRHEHDNPFTDGTFTLIAKGEDLQHQRPIGDDQVPQQPQSDPEPGDDRDPENIDIREETLEPAADQPPAPPEPAPEPEPEKAPEVPVPPTATEPVPAEKPVGVNPVEAEDGTVQPTPPPAPPVVDGGSTGPAPQPAPKAPPKRP